MATEQIALPPKLVDVFLGEARYRGAYGGRGSAKTRSFALMSAVRGYQMGKAGIEGKILCCRQFQNSIEESSLGEVKAAIKSVDWLDEYYDIGERYIKSRDGRIQYVFAGLQRNVDSIKSKARVLLCWVDEAEPVLDEAWNKLTKTVREDNSEIWVTWNPEAKGSATDKRFRQNPPASAKIVELNWQDNPWFPDVLELERQDDLRVRPDEVPHIWGGEYLEAHKGAYFTTHLAAAKAEHRIGNVAADPLLSVRAYWDIGGTGAKADHTTIWMVQFVGREIRVLNYYEAQGQPLATHIKWLRDNGYDKCCCVLPHDGSTQDKVYDVSYESALESAGFEVVVIPNQGKGAAMMRVEAARRLLASCYFHQPKVQPGLDALAWYHEKRDEARNIGLGPEHDWSSHAADAFGLMCVAYEEHSATGPDVSKFAIRGKKKGWLGN